MNELKFSRRALLLGVLPTAATLTLHDVHSAQPSTPTTTAACVDPDELMDGQISLGASLHYTDRSTDLDKTCSKCAYFQARESPACGQCKILNRPVSASGHCTSWSGKA